MILHPPFIITSRLMAGVKIGDATVSIGYAERQNDRDGRTVYQVYIDLADGTEYESTDLKSGCLGGSLQSGMGSLLGFLGAAAESYDYRQRTGRHGENEDLFPPAIVEWASQYSDELGSLQLEIEESDRPLIDEDGEDA